MADVAAATAMRAMARTWSDCSPGRSRVNISQMPWVMSRR